MLTHTQLVSLVVPFFLPLLSTARVWYGTLYHYHTSTIPYHTDLPPTMERSTVTTANNTNTRKNNQYEYILQPLPHFFNPFASINNDSKKSAAATKPFTSNRKNEQPSLSPSSSINLNVHAAATIGNVNTDPAVVLGGGERGKEGIERKDNSFLIGRMELIQSMVKFCTEERSIQKICHDQTNEQYYIDIKKAKCSKCEFWCNIGAKYLSKETLFFSTMNPCTVTSTCIHGNDDDDDDVKKDKKVPFLCINIKRKYIKLLYINGASLDGGGGGMRKKDHLTTTTCTTAIIETNPWVQYKIQHGDVLSISIPSTNKHNRNYYNNNNNDTVSVHTQQQNHYHNHNSSSSHHYLSFVLLLKSSVNNSRCHEYNIAAINERIQSNYTDSNDNKNGSAIRLERKYYPGSMDASNFAAAAVDVAVTNNNNNNNHSNNSISNDIKLGFFAKLRELRKRKLDQHKTCENHDDVNTDKYDIKIEATTSIVSKKTTTITAHDIHETLHHQQQNKSLAIVASQQQEEEEGIRVESNKINSPTTNNCQSLKENQSEESPILTMHHCSMIENSYSNDDNDDNDDNDNYEYHSHHRYHAFNNGTYIAQSNNLNETRGRDLNITKKKHVTLSELSLMELKQLQLDFTEWRNVNDDGEKNHLQQEKKVDENKTVSYINNKGTSSTSSSKRNLISNMKPQEILLELAIRNRENWSAIPRLIERTIVFDDK